jgi:cobalamin synthase
MRNEVLRDVVAGCAGVLAVAAVIGLPGGSVTVNHPEQFQFQHAVLLPHFSKVTAPVPPQAPARKIPAGP